MRCGSCIRTRAKVNKTEKAPVDVCACGVNALVCVAFWRALPPNGVTRFCFPLRCYNVVVSLEGACIRCVDAFPTADAHASFISTSAQTYSSVSASALLEQQGACVTADYEVEDDHINIVNTAR